jgi:NADH-quinone oxidoreductase subunit K
MWEVITFWLLSALILGSSGLAIFCVNPRRSAIGLAVCLVFLGASFAFLRSYPALGVYCGVLVVGVVGLWLATGPALGVGAVSAVSSKTHLWGLIAGLFVLFLAGKFGRLLFPVPAVLVSSSITMNHFLLLAFILFLVGLLGVLIRRHPVQVIIAIQLMFGGVNLALVSYGSFHGRSLDYGLFFVSVFTALASAAAGTGLIVSSVSTGSSSASILPDGEVAS